MRQTKVCIREKNNAIYAAGVQKRVRRNPGEMVITFAGGRIKIPVNFSPQVSKSHISDILA